jgi:PAS domain S-box-containing protein
MPSRVGARVEPFRPYHATLLVATAVSLGVAIDSLRHRERPGGQYLAPLMAGAALWAGAQLGRELASSGQLSRFMDQLVYVGIVTVVLCFLLFTLAFIGRGDLITRRLLAGLGVEPALVLGLAFTNPLHGWFWDRATGEVTLLFWGHTAYSYTILAVGTLLLVRAALRTRRLFQVQFAALVVGVVAPWLANAMLLFGPLETDLTAVAFTISGLSLFVATRRLGLMEAVPVARETLVDSLAAAVVVLDEDERVLDVNDAFEDLFPAADPAMGEPLSAVLADYPEVVTTIEDGRNATVALAGADGTRYVECTTAPVTDEHGRRLGRQAILRDVTTQKRRERDLQRQNEQLDQFASILSHDLRNPLNVAGARAELAAETGDLEHLEHVRDAHDRIESLLEDTLALARQGDTIEDPEPLGLEATARDAWSHVDTGDADLVLRADRQLRADWGRLCQLFENLFANAVEHGGDDVRVTVTTTEDGFVVADDGPGFDPDVREHLFEPGVTGPDGGTGLGLAIARQVALAHGWEIEAGAGADGGARFEITGVEWVDS